MIKVVNNFVDEMKEMNRSYLSRYASLQIQVDV